MCVRACDYQANVHVLNLLSLFRVDFEYLKDLPVLVLDVNDDFKNDKIKQECIIDKVCFWYYTGGTY